MFLGLYMCTHIYGLRTYIRLATFILSTFFLSTVFLAPFFLATFFFATFLVAFFAGRLAAFLATLRADDLRTAFFAVLRTDFFAAFLAGRFFAAFFVAMRWLSSSVELSGVAAQFKTSPRVSDPRPTADAHGASGRIRIRPARGADRLHGTHAHRHCAGTKNPHRMATRAGVPVTLRFRSGDDA